jgi:hypothetical protein
MKQRRFILSIIAISCFIATTALISGLGSAQTSLDAAMTTLITNTQKLGTPKLEGKPLFRHDESG